MNTLRKYRLNASTRKWLFAGLVLLVLFGLYRRKHRQEQVSAYQAEHITVIQTGNTTPVQLVDFACSLSGTPYLAGSADPEKGFDCSGFVTYVFKHFNIAVPRMSVDFTPIHHEVPLRDAKLGDLILFTGTDSTDRVVGHMGIVSSLPGEPLTFLHSTSGKARGVVETAFHTSYYQPRYIKTIRIFPQNDQASSR
ncbi:MAG TPA: NlpC/P60 family protein [Mucilaginibacter sp.]|nr:NlpC/P60 family protein [Mucilaginibacter sp.]